MMPASFLRPLGLVICLAGCSALGAAPPGGQRLSGLEVRATAGGISALSPAFSADVSDYSVDVQSDIVEVSVIVRPADPASRLRINGTTASAGVPFRLNLDAAGGTARIEVQDRGGPPSFSTVRIRREDISPVTARFRKLTFQDPATGVTIGYRLFVPDGYDASRGYPLVLFLHGAGESGSDNEVQLTANQGATVWAKPAEQARHPCFVLAPQNPKDPEATLPGDFGKRGWTSLLERGFSDPFRPQPALQTVHHLLSKVMKDYPVDAKRVYATGLSMGGFGVFALAADHPDTFAAIVGICGGLDPRKAAVLSRMPIWIFHAAADPTVDVRFSRDTVKALKAAGGAPRYTEYGEEAYFFPSAHLSWVPAYATREMRDWLFRQSR